MLIKNLITNIRKKFMVFQNFVNIFWIYEFIFLRIWMKFVYGHFKKKVGKKIFFPYFSSFLKLFHQKVWFKYQLGVLNTCLLVKNLITNIRKKFKVFQIPFPLFSFYFIIFSHLIFSDFLDSWIHFSKNLNDILHMGIICVSFK